jgi:hypothetical protein
MKFFNISFILVFALFSNLTFADGIKGKLTIELNGSKSMMGKYCQLFYTFNNQTGFNITGLNFKTSFKESDGSIIGKNFLMVDRLKNAVNVDTDQNVMESSCNEVKTVKLNPISQLIVDGDYRSDLFDMVEDNIIVSSKISGVSFVK